MFNDCPASMKNVMNSHIKEFYDLSQLRHVIVTKASECKRQRKRNQDFQLKPNEIESLKAACKALVRADRYNGSLLRGTVASEIQNDEKEAIRVYEAMLERVPKNTKAYFQYYKFLKRVMRKDKIDGVTRRMMTAIEDPSVPTDEWVEAHIVRADCLVALKRVDEAIETLEKLVSIIPPLPIPGLSYLAKLEKKQLNPEFEPDSPTGDIKISYNPPLKAAKSVSLSQSAKIGDRPGDDEDDQNEEDKEEKGAIKIKVIPSEDYAHLREQRFKELDLTERSRSNTNTRNARPLSSSLFLSTTRIVSICFT